MRRFAVFGGVFSESSVYVQQLPPAERERKALLPQSRRDDIAIAAHRQTPEVVGQVPYRPEEEILADTVTRSSPLPFVPALQT